MILVKFDSEGPPNVSGAGRAEYTARLLGLYVSSHHRARHFLEEGTPLHIQGYLAHNKLSNPLGPYAWSY